MEWPFTCSLDRRKTIGASDLKLRAPSIVKQQLYTAVHPSNQLEMYKINHQTRASTSGITVSRRRSLDQREI